VGGDFSCSNNQLTSLEGAPQEVGENFSCDNNQLTSLEGAPQRVGAWFECDAFKLEKGEWNLKGWLKILEKGSPEAQSLILTLPTLSPEFLNKEIQKDPTGMIMKLKSVWKNPEFKKIRDQLVIPDRYKEDAELVGYLGDLGF